MKKFLQFILFSILLTNYTFAYDWLYVQDPRGWGGGQGTIEEAVLSVKPHGIYMEYGLYLTFSARNLYFTSSDTLEVQFHFDLPENAIVFDSWLWIEEEIIRGKIMDQWTASAIYEDIVNRRRDPSILFKRGGSSYELRIFPMAGNSTRKIKISYLVPAQWNASSVRSVLPTNLLQTSYNPVSSLHLVTWLNSNYKNPKILEYPSINFQVKEDTLFGVYHEANITSEFLNNSLNFNAETQINNGIYLSKFQNEDEGYYQMALLPSKALNIASSNKAAILVDYVASKSDVSRNELLTSLKSNILSNFSSKDSFNLIFSNINIFRLAEKWIPADSISVDSIFQNLSEDQISNYSNLPSLLSDGIDFVKNNGNDGSLILVSNSDQVGEYAVANELIEDLLGLMNKVLPIHVINYQNQDYNYYYFGGRSYYGNEYFYLNITRLTSANYFNIFNYSTYQSFSFSDIMTSCFQSLGGFISSFDLHTKLGSGFCYGRYNLDLNSASVYLNKPILQIGKFKGAFPFEIQVSGVYKSEPFTQTFNIEEGEIVAADSLTEEMWAGNYIKFLEGQTQSNDVVNEIVDYSINERVLSIYSAFLCLEPSRGGEVCYDCLDESKATEVTDSLINKNDSLSLSAYPNPFNSQINLNVKLPASFRGENTFRIYDILGQLIKTFEPDLSAGRNEYRFTWNGTSDNGIYVSSGNYFFIVTTPEKVFSKKLLLLK